MGKGIITIDIPENCFECPLLNGNDECILQDEDTNAFYADDYDGLRKNCPVKEPPERHVTDAKQVGEEWSVFNRGWNHCLDTILDN